MPICFFIDEIQYMKQNELGSLIAALHRTNQLGYPVRYKELDFTVPEISGFIERLEEYKEWKKDNQ